MDTNVSLSSIPLSESDRLLQSWGYDLVGEYATIAGQIPVSRDPVLELATGTGRMCSVLSFSFPVILSGDISMKDLPKTLNRLPRQHSHRLSFVQLNMERLPFRSDSVKTIVCMNTMHEVTAPRLCLQEMIRVLHPEGRLIVGDFNPTGFDVMQNVHRVIYHNDHTTGSMSRQEVETIIRSSFTETRIQPTPLNITVFASGKK
ncbi:MAG: class I SAM-dependent methyltransferase [Bacteroidota bacterium]